MFTHANGSCGGGFTSVCLSVFSQGILKTDAAKITKPAIEMFYNESWKPIYFIIQRSRGTDITSAGLCTLVNADFSSWITTGNWKRREIAVWKNLLEN